jgi:predicted heme/steroid binding protein
MGLLEETNMSDLVFTRAQLRRYDGDDGPAYIAYQGVVYDVSQCARWRGTMHEGQHFPGQDLTGELREAPHGAEVFRHPCVRRVGILID